ncbi:MAG: hypothetical protein MJ105_03015 [Lachnospiraceae bacterium]|nr:hypothetical protein [Lachnospiraceae bacterium]
MRMMKKTVFPMLVVVAILFMIFSVRAKGSENAELDAKEELRLAEDSYVRLIRDRLEEEGFAYAGVNLSCERTAISSTYTVYVHHARLSECDADELSELFDSLRVVPYPVKYADVEFCLQK